MSVRHNLKEEHRAVSDTVAFILMFAIIITGVGVVSLGAFDQLTEFSNREQIENSERGMEAAAATLDDIHRRNDTRRTFALALGGGKVTLEGNSEITVGYGTGIDGFPRTVTLRSLEHRFERSTDDKIVSYEGGAVFSRPGVSTSYEPTIKCRPDQATPTTGDNIAIVSVVTLNPNNFAISKGSNNDVVLNPRAVSGESPVADLDESLLFSAEVDKVNTIFRSRSTGSTQQLTIDAQNTRNPEQWEYYFEQESGWNEITSTTNEFDFRCKNVRKLMFRQVKIDLSL